MLLQHAHLRKHMDIGHEPKQSCFSQLLRHKVDTPGLLVRQPTKRQKYRVFTEFGNVFANAFAI